MPSEDWRLSSTYEPLLELDRGGFAWEFLRRNLNYQQDYTQFQVIAPVEAELSPFPGAWGLRFPG